MPINMSPKTVVRNRAARTTQASRLATALAPGSGKPSIPGQVKVGMWLSTAPVKISCNGSGDIATTYTPTLATLSGVTSYQGVYDEYRITAIKFHILAVGSNAGMTAFFIDDADANNPTQGQAWSRRPVVLPNNHINPDCRRTLKYRSQNMTDLTFLSTATQSTFAFAALKVYTDNAYYGTAAAAASMWTVWAEVFVEFRGIGAP